MKRFGICAAIVAAALLLPAATASAGDRHHGHSRGHHSGHHRSHSGVSVSVGGYGYGAYYGHGGNYYSPHRHYAPSYGYGYSYPTSSHGAYSGGCW